MITIYDYQMMLGQKYGGISRYFHELIIRLNKNPEISTKLLCLFNDNAYFTSPKIAKFYSSLKGKRFINRTLTKFYLSAFKYDIFHPTYYDPYFMKYNKGKLVITVYDMIHELLPEYFSQNDILTKNKRLLIEKADGIIAISQSTKNDILKLFPEVDERKIKVIYLSSDFRKSTLASRPQSFPEKYVLFVGTRTGYKNFRLFCDAMTELLKKDDELNVMCVGGGAFTNEELQHMGSVAGKYHQINLNDELLSAAYTFAECFVFPSKYEGFGIPTLEAFACECPVALSNTSSMPEVGGDAVMYFNPDDPNEMRDAIHGILSSESVKKDLMEKGTLRFKEFDWDAISMKTLEFYREILNK